MAKQRTYRVKDVAELAGVSVRALHHYHELGLLVPGQRSASGYRLYTEQDLLRLQQILLQRELGLSLEQIRGLLDDPAFDQRQALLAQREQLKQRAAQTEAMLRAVEQALAALGGRYPQEHSDMKQLFAGFDPAKYETEAKQRWGDTDTYKESMRRTQSYGKQDWERMSAEQAETYSAAWQLLQAGAAPDSDAAKGVAERHRLLIERWFYPCDLQRHCGLAELYESDQRFAQNIDQYGAGLTTFLVAAIRANARR